jgi:hypothetical protein
MRYSVQISKETAEELRNIRRVSGFPQKVVIQLALQEWVARHINESTVIGKSLRAIGQGEERSNSVRFLELCGFSKDQQEQQKFYETEVSEVLDTFSYLSIKTLEKIQGKIDGAYNEGFFSDDAHNRIRQCVEEVI